MVAISESSVVEHNGVCANARETPSLVCCCGTLNHVILFCILGSAKRTKGKCYQQLLGGFYKYAGALPPVMEKCNADGWIWAASNA